MLENKEKEKKEKEKSRKKLVSTSLQMRFFLAFLTKSCKWILDACQSSRQKATQAGEKNKAKQPTCKFWPHLEQSGDSFFLLFPFGILFGQKLQVSCFALFFFPPWDAFVYHFFGKWFHLCREEMVEMV